MSDIFTLNDPYNIRHPDYGAKAVGNDDSEAFNKVIDAVNKNGGGDIYIPPGKYVIAKQLIPIHAQHVLLWMSSTATLINAIKDPNNPSKSYDLLTLGNRKGKPHGFQMYGGVITGEGNVQAGVAIKLNGVQHCSFYSTTILRHKMGIWLADGCFMNDFYSIKIDSISDGLSDMGSAIRLTNASNENHFYGGLIHGHCDVGVRIEDSTSNIFFTAIVPNITKNGHIRLEWSGDYNKVTSLNRFMGRIEGHIIPTSPGQVFCQAGTVDNRFLHTVGPLGKVRDESNANYFISSIAPKYDESMNRFRNSAFLQWSGQSSHTPLDWVFEPSPGGGTIEKETDPKNVHKGTTSVKLTYPGKNYTYTGIMQKIEVSQIDLAYLTRKMVTIGAWIKTAKAGIVKAYLKTSVKHSDGTSKNYSNQGPPHSGSDEWEWVGISHLVRPGATGIEARFIIDKDSSKDPITAYISQPVAVLGHIISDTGGRTMTDAGGRFYGPVEIPLPVYSDTTRPPASHFSVGTAIFNTSDNAPNYSDGTQWRDAMGKVT